MRAAIFEGDRFSCIVTIEYVLFTHYGDLNRVFTHR